MPSKSRTHKDECCRYMYFKEGTLFTKLDEYVKSAVNNPINQRHLPIHRMHSFKNILYLIRQLGIKRSACYFLSLPVRFLFRFNRTIFDFKTEIRSHYKIRELISNANIRRLPALSDNLKTEIDQLFNRYNLPDNTIWHQFFISINDIEKPGYLSEYIYYSFIEPRLNVSSMAGAYSDKNIYQKIFPSLHHPRTVLRYINGRYYDADYTHLSKTEARHRLLEYKDMMIIKPSINSGRGRNIYKVTAENSMINLNESTKEFDDLAQICPEGFIVQEMLEQHPDLSKFHPESLNTIRITTFRFQQDITVLSAILKMGNHGHYLDKMAFNGLSCGIDSSGTLFSNALDNHFKKQTQHPESGVFFQGFHIPGFQNVCDIVTNTHKQLPYFDIISWDVAISPESKPVLIEINLRSQGIIYQQAIFGPLFGDYSKELLENLFNT